MKKFVDLGNRIAVITYYERPVFEGNEEKYIKFKVLGSFQRDEDEQKEYEEMKPTKGYIRPYINDVEIVSTVSDSSPNDKVIQGDQWRQINTAWLDVEKEYEGKETTFYEAFLDIDHS